MLQPAQPDFLAGGSGVEAWAAGAAGGWIAIAAEL
jgi:hypothetical protein